MKFWFDLELSLKDIERLEKLRGALTQMDYVKEALIEKMDRDEKAIILGIKELRGEKEA